MTANKTIAAIVGLLSMAQGASTLDARRQFRGSNNKDDNQRVLQDDTPLSMSMPEEIIPSFPSADLPDITNIVTDLINEGVSVDIPQAMSILASSMDDMPLHDLGEDGYYFCSWFVNIVLEKIHFDGDPSHFVFKVCGPPPGPPPTPPPTPGVKVFYSFTPGSLDVVSMASADLRMAKIEELQGNPDESHAMYGEALTPEQRAALRSIVDAAFDETFSGDGKVTDVNTRQKTEEDFRHDISAETLLDVLGLSTFQHISSLFKRFTDKPVTWFAIRKSTLSGDKHIRYHQDDENFVMHVWLNEETDDVEGGNIVYLHRNGTDFVDIVPGGVVVHGNKLVHGITNVIGTRYILVLGGADVKKRDEMQAAMEHAMSREEL